MDVGADRAGHDAVDPPRCAHILRGWNACVHRARVHPVGDLRAAREFRGAGDASLQAGAAKFLDRLPGLSPLSRPAA